MEKIAFCITCMNRLNHLQQTLEKNIQDNYLIGKVEFVLLNYNSKDGLEEWVQNTMQKFIDEGILIYYRTTDPLYYLRSHSRNMAFRLANADILCNLDADNFLGKGFASFMLQEFSKYDNIFYMNEYKCDDTFGRVCVRKEDFELIRGYNETLQGWGYEDNDFQNRLKIEGLIPKCFQNPEFGSFLEHPDSDRISDENVFNNIKKMYIAYINPYTSNILLLYENYNTEQYTLINNAHLNLIKIFSNRNNLFLDDRFRIVIGEKVIKGTWTENNNIICINENNTKCLLHNDISFNFKNMIFYHVQDSKIQNRILLLLSSAINYSITIKQITEKSVINPNGFGKGSVYKNFDLSHQIILS